MKHRVAIPILLVWAWVSSAAAHHSANASFDSSKPVTLTGTIVKVDWANPHARITLQVKLENGQFSTRQVEMAGPGRLKQVGADLSLFPVGQTITVEAWPRRDFPEMKDNVVSGRTAILADGRRLDIHDSWGER